MLMYSAVYKIAFAFMNRNKRLEDTEEETYMFLRTLSPILCFCYYSLLLIFFNIFVFYFHTNKLCT